MKYDIEYPSGDGYLYGSLYVYGYPDGNGYGYIRGDGNGYGFKQYNYPIYQLIKVNI